MRSTVIIDDGLFERAKQRAAAQNTTLSAVVNEALRAALSRALPEPPAFHMVTFGSRWGMLHREPRDLQASIEEEEREAGPGPTIAGA